MIYHDFCRAAVVTPANQKNKYANGAGRIAIKRKRGKNVLRVAG
jgi:hypothetical protein